MVLLGFGVCVMFVGFYRSFGLLVWFLEFDFLGLYFGCAGDWFIYRTRLMVVSSYGVGVRG